MAVERLVIRGKFDREAEVEQVKLIISSAPATGGRSRQRAVEVYDDIAQTVNDLPTFLTQTFPDNDPAA